MPSIPSCKRFTLKEEHHQELEDSQEELEASLEGHQEQADNQDQVWMKSIDLDCIYNKYLSVSANK
jgi:hypothetical protein